MVVMYWSGEAFSESMAYFTVHDIEFSWTVIHDHDDSLLQRIDDTVTFNRLHYTWHDVGLPVVGNGLRLATCNQQLIDTV